MTLTCARLLLLSWIAMAFFTGSLSAQNGQFDVRFNSGGVDCANDELYIDVQIKATSPANTFNLSLQNYRFTFNKNATQAIAPPIAFPETNPSDRSVGILQELQVSGIVNQDGNISVYADHTLTGSVDSIVAYNVTLNGGVGYFVSDTGWTSIGRVRFDQVATPACLQLNWQNNIVGTPLTFIAEIFNSLLFPVAAGSFNNYTICFTDLCSGLPIELAYFEARENDCSMDLTWRSLTEQGSAYFDVEKSLDGITFIPIGRVPASGNSIDPVNYSFIDSQPAAFNYYRLNQVDLDGSQTYSQTVSIRSACFDQAPESGISSVYPNFIRHESSVRFYVNLPVELPAGRLLIYDASGVRVLQKVVNLTVGPQEVVLPVYDLMAGVYFVQLEGDGWFSEVQKLIKLE